MYPGMLYRWKRARGGCEARACADGGSHHDPHHHGPHHGPHPGFEAAGHGHGHGFGVRRPLRFMAHRLDLDDGQIKQLAQMLDDLKTERAQAEVDDRRTLAALAKSLEAEAFDQAAVNEALQRRVASAERLRDAVKETLAKTHELLDSEQRAKLAYLLRSGALTI